VEALRSIEKQYQQRQRDRDAASTKPIRNARPSKRKPMDRLVRWFPAPSGSNRLGNDGVVKPIAAIEKHQVR